MSITVVIKMIGGWLLIDLCFLAIFQDETNFITQEFQNTAELFISFDWYRVDSLPLEGHMFKSCQLDLASF